MARMITPQEMMNGGILNGVAVDAVTYLLGSLHAKFSALEEESRLTAMTDMLAFARRPSESINAVLARYEVVRQRAALEGQFVMSNVRHPGAAPSTSSNHLEASSPRTTCSFNSYVPNFAAMVTSLKMPPAMSLPPYMGRPGKRDQGHT